MSNADGKTERATGKRSKAIDTSVPRRERLSTTQGNNPGLQGYFQNDQGVSIRGNQLEYSQPKNSDFGKILERLENLERRFSSYVRSHQERLDLRKKESQLAEEEFAKEAADLKQHILSLMQDSAQDSTEENT